MPQPSTTPSPALSAYAALRDRLLADFADGVERWDDGRFDELALAVHAFQYAHVPAYRSWCDAVGTDSAPTSWHEVPALPIAAFKRLDVSIPGVTRTHEWHSSSTTGQGYSRHALPDAQLYDAALDAGVRAALLPDAPGAGPAPLRAIQLAADGDALPHSSLSHMLDRVRTRMCEDGGCFADATTVDADAAWAALSAAAEDGAPVLLLATSFAVVQLLDAPGERRVTLPTGSRAMDTGGYKGRTRELTRDELVGAIGERLGIPAAMCENEYGMSELSSQAYLGTIAAQLGAPLPGTKSGARWAVPWMRTRVVDPVTLDEVADGETGLLVHHDLANLGSCAAIRSEDLGQRIGHGFRFVGRAPGAQLRGCSLPLEAILP